MPKDQRWDEIVATSCRNWNYLLKRGDSACFGVKNNFELSQKNSQLLTDRQWSRNGFCWHDVLGVHHKHSRPQVPPLHLQVAAECLSFQLEIHDSFIRVTVFLTSPPKKNKGMNVVTFLWFFIILAIFNTFVFPKKHLPGPCFRWEQEPIDVQDPGASRVGLW